MNLLFIYIVFSVASWDNPFLSLSFLLNYVVQKTQCTLYGEWNDYQTQYADVYVVYASLLSKRHTSTTITEIQNITFNCTYSHFSSIDIFSGMEVAGASGGYLNFVFSSRYCSHVNIATSHHHMYHIIITQFYQQ